MKGLKNLFTILTVLLCIVVQKENANAQLSFPQAAVSQALKDAYTSSLNGQPIKLDNAVTNNTDVPPSSSVFSLFNLQQRIRKQPFKLQIIPLRNLTVLRT